MKLFWNWFKNRLEPTTHIKYYLPETSVVLDTSEDKKKALQPGDKVIVYDSSLYVGCSKGVVQSNVNGWCYVGEVLLKTSDSYNPDYGSILVHEKQCRKLRKKK